ncbi:alpha/beta hydrolase [Phenylobacterium sp.]|uniref:alpha/beta fold hydrolase n=1 Tax=Phenylobacterium sp. TaxID=1871053 RepID=UPI00281266B3|nr:alpha/beta hydrolase [Phenylobacterium sp.]
MSKLTNAIRAGALALAAATAVPAVALAAQPAAATAQAPAKSGHVEANGVRYYYEVHGAATARPPLLLLHGGLGSIDMFRPLLPTFAADRQVIAVDLHGHGRTVLGERPFTLEAMGADMDTILGKLGYGKVDVVGYSMGGGVAFQLAAQKPERVNRLVLVSTSYSTDGFHSEMRPMQAQLSGQMAEAMKGTPMYDGYMAVAPRKQDFPKLLDTLGAFMRKDYDSSALIPRLTMPVMLVYGDADMFKPDHEIDFFKRLGGGLRDAGWQREHMSKHRLAILPGRTHYDVFLSPDLPRTTLTFLDGQDKGADWTVGK